jgi:hypothetical protein
MNPTASEVIRVYQFNATNLQYDLVESNGRLAVITSSKDGGDDGADSSSIVYLFEPDEAPLDGGLQNP